MNLLYQKLLNKPQRNLTFLCIPFYDLNLKTNYTLSKNNKLYLSGYFGRDTFKFGDNFGVGYGNLSGNLRWNHIFNDRLFSNVNFIFSDYDYALAFGDNELDKFEWNSKN